VLAAVCCVSADSSDEVVVMITGTYIDALASTNCMNRVQLSCMSVILIGSLDQLASFQHLHLLANVAACIEVVDKSACVEHVPTAAKRCHGLRLHFSNPCPGKIGVDMHCSPSWSHMPSHDVCSGVLYIGAPLNTPPSAPHPPLASYSVPQFLLNSPMYPVSH
jgi:hypothetical protein